MRILKRIIPERYYLKIILNKNKWASELFFVFGLKYFTTHYKDSVSTPAQLRWSLSKIPAW